MRLVETHPMVKSSKEARSKEIPKEVSTTSLLEQAIATKARAIVYVTFE